ncbi:hypothetical protein PGT21_012199 [Puccinia graminis f. sp. tritici]|uniref:Uncharacterized protein n=1 Tax=Puccinia graminis f. sp. tritici TaxID=56615 RepID=A0A5B0RIK7_PUCGR|nr:hypothetical protein PGT21_012199 [Puccinia graminis f. sp. tritici]KAA1124805.1 hypothetical protein PGTUg99_035196 [Puccinia graminis f. sp. tritici]
MILDRKTSRTSGLPRFKPSTQNLKQHSSGLLSPTQPDHHDSSPTKQLDHDSPYLAYSLPPISSLSAFKHWFDNTNPSPPSQAVPAVPQPASSSSSSAPTRALFSSVPNSSKSPLKATFKPTDTPLAAPQAKSENQPPSSPPTTTSSSSKTFIKPLSNSLRKRTSSNIFNRRLSSTSLLKSKNTNPDTDKSGQHRNSTHYDPNSPGSTTKPANIEKSSPPSGRDKNTPSTPKSPTLNNKSVLSPKRKLLSPKKQTPSSDTKLKTPKSITGARTEVPKNLLSLGIQYNPAIRSVTEPIYLSPPTPTAHRGPSLLKPGPRGSSLHPYSRDTDSLPSSMSRPTKPVDQFSPSRLTSRVSTLTLASTCTTGSDDDELMFSDLASIQLPSTPTDSLRPSFRSVDLLSDFPLPPSRDAFLSPSLDAAPLSRASHSEPIQLNLPRRLNYSPSLPPQIPLPPLPLAKGFELPTPLRNWSPLSYPNRTPTQPPTEAMVGSLTATNPPYPLDSPDISNASYNIDDLLDLYGNQKSPLTPLGFQRLHRPVLLAVDSKASSSSNVMKEAKSTDSNLLDADLPSRTSSPDNLSLDEPEKDDGGILSDDPFSRTRPRRSESMSMGDETSSEIDLNEPLDMMAVRLGYQLDLPDGSDSDAESDIRRNQDFEDEDELFDNPPAPSRGPSRQAMLQFRSQSSLRGNYAPSRCRMNRVIIAEASSSDEEEFDLKLDHQHLTKRTRRREESTELLGEQEPKWNGSPRNEWRRSSVGSAGTLGSFTTTPSSSHSSYQTNFSTPNSTQILSFPEPPVTKIKGLLGLGFEIEVPGSSERPSTATDHRARLDSREYQLPGKPGSAERREWLQRAFSNKPDHPLNHSQQERSSSMPIPSKPDPVDPSLIKETHRERSEDRSNESVEELSSPSSLDHPSDQAILDSRAEEKRCSRRLKPLMLVSRKERHQSYPLINSTILEEDGVSPLASARASVLSARLPSTIRPARNSCLIPPVSPSNSRPTPRGRTSLVNISYNRSSSAHHPLYLPRSSAV